jgi:hypothetical protein
LRAIVAFGVVGVCGDEARWSVDKAAPRVTVGSGNVTAIWHTNEHTRRHDVTFFCAPPNRRRRGDIDRAAAIEWQADVR